MRKLDPGALIEGALVKACETDVLAAGRIARLRRQIDNAEHSVDVLPLDQVLAVLALLESAGCATPGIDVRDTRARLDRRATRVLK